jgi:hypothetical protein
MFRVMQPTTWDYTRLEFERRFLVDPARLDFSALESYSKLLEDIYFDFGRMRLRRQTDSDTGLVKYKLTKKFDLSEEIAKTSGAPVKSASAAPGHVRSIVSTWLSEGEYQAFATLGGRTLRKRRHYYKPPGFSYGVDVFEGELAGLILCEFEGEDEAELYRIAPPSFADIEVTDKSFFTGGNLSRVSRQEVAAQLGAAQ